MNRDASVDPYRPVLPAAVASATAPLVHVELERALVRRLATWAWPDILLGGIALLALMVGRGGSWVALFIILVMVLIRAEARITVGPDEFAIVGGEVVVGRTVDVPPTERLTPPRILTRTFVVAWRPAPIPTSDGRAFDLGLRLWLRVVPVLSTARRASAHLVHWQRDPDRFAIDLRRHLLPGIVARLVRQAPEAPLDADTLTIDLRDALPPRVAEWGLVLDDVQVVGLDRVAPDPEACDRVRVTDRHAA